MIYGFAPHHYNSLLIDFHLLKAVTSTNIVLQSLRWLPVRQRVTFKLATLVHKCLNGRAPGYLAYDFRLAGRGRPDSWSAASMMLDILRRRHWETEHLPSPDRVSGTAFLLPSVIRHCRRQSSESC